MRRFTRPAARAGMLAAAIGGVALVSLTAIAAASLGQPDAPALPRVARQIAEGENLRIVAFGSSSTEGVGASKPSASYPARLQAILDNALPGKVTVLNRGVGGEAVDEMVRRIDRDVLSAKPDLVIWQTGSNDPLRNVPLDHFKAETRAALARMRDAGVDVMLMEPQWCPRLDGTPGAEGFRDAVREIGEEMDVPVIRRSEMMREWVASDRIERKDLFAPDGLHMADGGYALLAREAASEILHESEAMATPAGEAAAVAIEQ